MEDAACLKIVNVAGWLVMAVLALAARTRPPTKRRSFTGWLLVTGALLLGAANVGAAVVRGDSGALIINLVVHGLILLFAAGMVSGKIHYGSEGRDVPSNPD